MKKCLMILCMFVFIMIGCNDSNNNEVIDNTEEPEILFPTEEPDVVIPEEPDVVIPDVIPDVDVNELSLSERFVLSHNEWRDDVGVIPLVWNEGIAETATEWAQQLVDENDFYHDPNRGGYGENIAMGYRNPEDVVSAWCEEIQNYDYETNTCCEGCVCGHYTQAVWSDTIEIGCGWAGTIWVCRYYPPGNYIGQKPY